ncbi:MAG: Nif3-like dinuclear metal center hexameric protein [Clostridia bacterium]|nr:Nif3-like dinuclear metal center hexameric protein [Clostridia bacterium]
MRAEDVLSVLEKEVAPVSMSDEFCSKYSAYDNSGIIYDSGTDASGILFSLDMSPMTLAEAEKLGAGCVVTHHPAIFKGLKRILPSDPGPRALAGCVKAGISVISMHLNFDCAPCGTDYHLMKALGGDREDSLLSPVNGGGYGRVYDVSPVSFGKFCRDAMSVLNTKRAFMYGDENKVIKRVASFCGAGGDEEAVAFAAGLGADAFVSADMKHHVVAELVQRGMCVLELTHYASESYGLRKIYEKLSGALTDCELWFYEDASML